ncbi:hypothetical protein FHETE_3650 [Fusarium heterosporum]|uniref:DUF7580 domain-containing protein n=1 Tax=Fusarium heterosporum TaxID=42747 RepID=A0A8H5TMC6_FUSHE|nr:hypothetical protein FHETE_3650 [Fusarium heterosporum]
MSDFEMVGVVLGSIPIVISALEYYTKGLDTFQNFKIYKRILQRLILTLKTEHLTLQNVCEKLLNRIAPQVHIEEMIGNPFGDRWKEKEIFDKLRLRLWTSLSVFHERIQDISEAIEEMMEKLKIDTSSGGVSFEASSTRKLFKQVRFVLQKANHEEALARIREGVSALEGVADSNKGLEPTRKSRSDGRLNKLVKGMLNSIYHALRGTINCKSPSPRQWNEVVIKSSKYSTSTASTQIGTSASQTTGFLTPSSRVSAMFGQQSTQTLTVGSATESLAMSTFRTMAISSRHINNLCEIMQSMGKKKQGDSCGHIQECHTQENLKYDVCVQECLDNGGEWSLVPLKQLLQDPSLLYHERLRLAYMIACSALQMQGTPWINVIPSSEEIYVCRKKGLLQFQHVFVLRYFPECIQSSAPTTSPNLFLLYLGILLIELILGQSMPDIDSSQTHGREPSLPGYILDYDAASKLLGRVKTAGGAGYYKAVEGCLKSYMYKPDAADGTSSFQSDIISSIISPLEQDLRSAAAVL